MVRVVDRQLEAPRPARLTQLDRSESLAPFDPVDWPLPPTIDLLGYEVADLVSEEFVELLVERAAADLPISVAYLNAHTFNLALDDAALADALRRCDVLYADGQSVVWASRRLGRPLTERMTAADTFPIFARRAAGRGLSLYLLGGRPGAASLAAERLVAAYPTLSIAGVHDGYFADAQTNRVVDQVNGSNAAALIVGMGSPRQELWLVENAARLRPPLRWCVGALFDYLAGREPRAPQWLCRVGGEWLFRLLADPTGKWRRYLVGNPRFAWHVLHGTRRKTDPIAVSTPAPAEP
jgi:N-acetylglucosaminyldiphosphoundecaprenol N-acetyl-beta-D-mannosaminyltransferase